MTGIPEEQQASAKIILDVLKAEVAELVTEKMAEAAKKITSNVPTSPQPEPIVVDNKPLEKGLAFARCVRYMALENNDSERAIKRAHDNGEKSFADVWEKSLNISSLVAGGNLIPPQFSEEWIEELGAKSVVRAMGVTEMPMNGQLELSGIDTSASAAYVTEGQNITPNQPTTRGVVLSEKTLAMVVPLSNRLLALGGAKVDRFIRDHMLRIAARKEDVTFIRSSGTQGEPKGMLTLAAAANKFDANGTVTVVTVTEELGRAVQKLMAANVDLDANPGYLISPRTWKYLATARDGNNNLVWKGEMAQGRLNGFPWKQTSQIPENLGAGSNESEVHFAAFGEIVLGESQMMELEAFPGGSYYDGSNVVSGISKNETVLRLLAHHDLNVLHQGLEIAVIQAVKWGV